MSMNSMRRSAQTNTGECSYSDVARGMHTFTSTMRFRPRAGGIKRQSELRSIDVSRREAFEAR
jgi:hypothetical protein